MSPSRRNPNGEGTTPADTEAEAKELESALAGTASEDQAEALIAAEPRSVIVEAEELENEAELAGRRRAVKNPGPGNPVFNAFRRLYRGQTSFDFVGRRRWWFALSGVIIVAGMSSLGFRGFNLGIDFKGGTAWQVADHGLTASAATTAAQNAGVSLPTVEILGSKTLEVQGDLNSLSPNAQQAEITKVSDALARATHTNPNNVSIETVGPTWGGQITKRALEALIAFFILVAIYISFRFEPKMAVAAFTALVHDLLVTAGVYSLAGFQVTPDTVIAVLTILGYSLYDTVVVFDRVRDNSKGLGATGKMTYTEMVNLSMNQTLARSINTSLVAILPVLAVLLVGADLLGAVTLQNYGLALFIGLLSGAYSSIFIASPVLAMLKEREPRYATIRNRLESRGERFGLLTPSAAAQLAGATAGGGGGRIGGSRAAGRAATGALRPGAASQTGRKANAPAKGTTRPPGSGATAASAGGAAKAGGGSAGPRPVARPRKPGAKGGKGKKRR